MEKSLWALDDFELRAKLINARVTLSIQDSKIKKLEGALEALVARLNSAGEYPRYENESRVGALIAEVRRSIRSANIEYKALESIVDDLTAEQTRRDPPRLTRAERERIERDHDGFWARKARRING